MKNYAAFAAFVSLALLAAQPTFANCGDKNCAGAKCDKMKKGMHTKSTAKVSEKKTVESTQTSKVPTAK